MEKAPKLFVRILALSAIAGMSAGVMQVQSIELTPGRWVVDHNLTAPARGLSHSEQSEFCLTEERATLTFDQILAELNWAQCRTTSLILTQSTGQADLICTYPEDGNVTLRGTMEATYSKEAYRIEARTLPPGDSVYVGNGRRVGPC